MSAQRLGKKMLRRISSAANANVIRGWAHGGYMFNFVTAEHFHGYYDKRDGNVVWYPPDEGHYSSCYSEEWPEHLRARH